VPEAFPENLGRQDLGWRVVTRVPATAAELVVDLLWQHDVQAVEERDDGSGHVLYIAGVQSESVADELVIVLREHGLVTREAVVDDAWLDSWREHARVAVVGRVVVVPAWVSEPDTLPDDPLVITLEPGRAFGSGAHETTRLALAALIDHVRAGDRVLDVGCGSGVLSMAAALLGAASVEALDLDPAAVAATRDNARRNGVESTVHAALDGVGGSSGSTDPVDLVVANILAPVLIELAPNVVRRLSSSGRVILSGFLAEQVDRVTSAFAPLVVLDRSVDGSWHCVVLGPHAG
jgi:ribosomal protein L11 methyltransferase